MYRPIVEGGMAMHYIEARIIAISVQQFLYFCRRLSSPFYFFFLSLYWLKFQIAKLNLTNFDSMPSCLEDIQPNWYKDIVNNIKWIICKENNFFIERTK